MENSANYITSAKVEKEYHVMVDGMVTPEHIKLKNGVDISVNGQSYTTKPCIADILNDTSHITKRFVRDENMELHLGFLLQLRKVNLDKYEK